MKTIFLLNIDGKEYACHFFMGDKNRISMKLVDGTDIILPLKNPVIQVAVKLTNLSRNLD
jgi:hypothetical protein